jgi:putative hydrolase
VSEPDPLGDNPFGGVPIFGDLFRMLGNQGSLSWDAARQFAVAVATEGKAESNVDPADRFRWQELARIAELHVQDATGLDTAVGGRSPEITPVTPGTWAIRTLDAYKPLFDQLATSLGGSRPNAEAGEDRDDPAALMSSLMALFSPVMLGMSAGSMVGHLARRSFGQFDLPIPRPPSPELLVVPSAVERFADDWSLAPDDLRLWVCLSELTSHVVIGVPHVRSELQRLLAEYAGGFRPDASALGDRLSSIDPLVMGSGDPMAELQRALGDPEILLGAIRSPQQRDLLPRLDALVAVVVGVVDHVLDRTAPGLLGSGSRIAEAVRRRRVEADQSDVFVERLLGLTLTQAQVDRGSAFVGGVVERGGDAALARLWRSVRELPTPAEVDAPGLWLARIDLPD